MKFLRNPHKLPSRRAFSMVEVMVGMMVLASASVLVSSSLSSSSAQIDDGRRIATAGAIASQQLDWYMNLPETLSLPQQFSVPTVGAMSVTETLVLPTQVSAASGWSYLTGAPASTRTNSRAVAGTEPGYLPVARLSPSQQEFLAGDNEMRVRVSKACLAGPGGTLPASDELRYYQVEIVDRPTGRLLFSAGQIGNRLDPRSR